MSKKNREKNRGECVDCKVDVFEIKEYSYMVTSEVWAAAGKEPQTHHRSQIAGLLHQAGLITRKNAMQHFDSGGFLCIGCLEDRLGRTLTQEDFKMHVPINNFSWSQSERLQDRLAS